jgi:hypothetical protein
MKAVCLIGTLTTRYDFVRQLPRSVYQWRNSQYYVLYLTKKHFYVVFFLGWEGAICGGQN